MRLALSLSSLSFVANALIAQTPRTGEIIGTVRDSAGAPIPNAQVFVVGTAFAALANSHGAYSILDLPPGAVAVRAAFVGYRPVRVDSVKVEAARTSRVDFVLPRGGTDIYPVLVYCECPQVERDLNSTRWNISGWMLGQ